MDDLKIIFYLVVTLLWFFFNNYRKIRKQARERQNKQPDPETTPESETPDFDWEQIFGEGRSASESPEIEPERQYKVPAGKPKGEVNPRSRGILDSGKVKKPVPSTEGGTLSPLQRTDFKKSLRKRVSDGSRSKKIRRSNWKKAVILSEVLHPPYV